MAPRNYFASLSVETIEQILIEVTCHSDLLSLALTEQRMRSLIIPDFLEYYHLKFCISREDIWQHLNGRPSVCARVRQLELFTGNYYAVWRDQVPETVVPQSLRSLYDLIYDGKFVATHEVCSALTKMTNLKQIIFVNSRGLRTHMSSQDFAAIVLSVYNSGCKLEYVELRFAFRSDWITPEFAPRLGKMLSDTNWLSSLKICNLITQQLSPSHDFNSNLLSVVFQMVNLTHLQLITTFQEQPFFRDDVTYHWPKWPKLESFYLGGGSLWGGLVNVPHLDPEFILKHPRLHTLRLNGVFFLPLMIDSKNMISPLKSFGRTSTILQFGDDDHDDLPKINIPWSTFNNLTHLTCEFQDKSDLDIFGELISLESCYVYHCSPELGINNKERVEEILSRIAHGCKNLKKLCWECLCYVFEPDDDTTVPSCAQDMTNLTHLLGITSPNGQLDKNINATMKKLYKFPKLHYVGSFNSVLELRRNDIAQQMVYEDIPFDSIPESCQYEQWGGFTPVLEEELDLVDSDDDE